MVSELILCRSTSVSTFYIRSTIDEERLTGLALMNIHSNNTEEINTFATFHLQLFLAVLAKPRTVKT